ncbi:hypothetical protein OC844_001646 [Tilletia horrida]|nr:hypothetical protein OC844_001646 [Tilletia horrida]
MSGGEHIAIVGGGICGVCTAFYLLKAGVPGANITLIEAQGIASKASGKAGGFITQAWHGPATASLGRLSYELHTELASELDGERTYGYRSPLSNISLAVRPAGREMVAKADEAALALALSAANKTQDESGGGAQLHTHSAVHEIIFRARPAATGPAPASAWLDERNVREKELIGDPNGSAQVHPRLFCETVWAECERRGVRFVRAEVQGMSSSSTADGAGRRVLSLTKGKEEAVPFTKLVVAAGPWSGQLLQKMCGFDAGIITNLPGHSVIIEPTQPLPAEALFADIRGVPASDVTLGPELFVRPDSTVYAAGENTGEALPQDLHDDAFDEDAIKRLLKACALISPALAQGRVLSKALCYRPMTDRGNPIISAVPGEEGIFLLSGHGPWGISLGPGSGKVMAELLLGKTLSAEISALTL